MAQLPFYSNKAAKDLIFQPTAYLNHREEVDRLFGMFERSDVVDYYFRGMGKASYKLYTSGQRYRIENDILIDEIDGASLYQRILHRTRRAQGGVIEQLMDASGISRHDDIALFSYIQHHGGPSPFLDFTEDPFVAMYFAAEKVKICPTENELDQYFSVYSVPRYVAKPFNFQWKQAGPRWGLEGTHMASYSAWHQGKCLVMTQDWIQQEIGPEVGRVRNNLNIINQKGLFICNNEPTLPLMEMILEHESKLAHAALKDRLMSSHFKCVNIHNSLAEYVQEKLAARNPAVVEPFIYPVPGDILTEVKSPCVR